MSRFCIQAFHFLTFFTFILKPKTCPPFPPNPFSQSRNYLNSQMATSGAVHVSFCDGFAVFLIKMIRMLSGCSSRFINGLKGMRKRKGRVVSPQFVVTVVISLVVVTSIQVLTSLRSSALQLPAGFAPSCHTNASTACIFAR